MRVVTIPPDNVIASSGNPPAATGTAAADAVAFAEKVPTSGLGLDGNPGNFWVFSGQWSFGGSVGIGWFVRARFDDIDLAVNERIWGVDILMIGSGNFLKLESYFGLSDVDLGMYLLGPLGTDPSNWTGVRQNFVSPVYNQDWNGDPWDATQINALHFYIEQTEAEDPSLAAIGQVSLRVYKVSQPTVRIAYPSYGLRGVSAAPQIKWYYGGDGEPQNRYHLKIFDQVTAEDSGFDPETDTPVYDSGVVVSSKQAHSVPPGFLDSNEIYYVTVLVYKTMDFNGAIGLGLYASPWAVATKFRTNKKPTLTVTAPPDPVTTTTYPLIQWTYDDEELTPQGKFHIRLFTDAQASIGGFDPETSPCTWDSGELEGDDTEYRVKMSLPGTPSSPETYQVFVKVAQAGDELWSNWEYKVFALYVDRPEAPPSCAATPDNDEGFFTVAVDVPDTGPAIDYFVFERSEDGGETWEIPRGLGEVPNDSDPIEVVDHEARVVIPVTYRVHGVQESVDGPVDGGSTSCTGSIDSPYVWTKNPLDPTKNARLPIEEDWQEITITTLRTVHRGFGREKPAVVRGVGNDVTFPLTYLIETDARREKLWDLIGEDEVLLIITPKGKWFVEIMTKTQIAHLWDELHNEQPLSRFPITFQEVEAP